MERSGKLPPRSISTSRATPRSSCTSLVTRCADREDGAIRSCSHRTKPLSATSPPFVRRARQSASHPVRSHDWRNLIVTVSGDDGRPRDVELSTTDVVSIEPRDGARHRDSKIVTRKLPFLPTADSTAARCWRCASARRFTGRDRAIKRGRHAAFEPRRASPPVAGPVAATAACSRSFSRK